MFFFRFLLSDQEYRLVYNEKNLVVEILVNSTVKTFKRALRQLFLSNLSQKYFVNASKPFCDLYQFYNFLINYWFFFPLLFFSIVAVDLNTNGDINLQDSVFNSDDLVELLNDEQIKSSLAAVKDSNKTSVFLNSKLFELNKNWKQIEKSHKNIHFASTKLLNQPTSAASEASSSTISFNDFLADLGKFLNDRPLEQFMDSSKVIGTLRIQKPILYIFPAREGDSAYFTINGYSMLINGGYDRVKPCFWSFVSMLQQIDSVLITHTDSDALGGLSSFFGKKLIDADVKPTVLSVLGNLIASKQSSDQSATSLNGGTNSPKPRTSTAALAANLIANDVSERKLAANFSHADVILESIERLKIKLLPLVKSNDMSSLSKSQNSKYEHINLYYKLGQGSLDLYVLSPFANSNEYKEFVQQQQNHFAKQTHHKSQLNMNQMFKNIPLSHLSSAVVLLVWMPSAVGGSKNENSALRLLFTGNAPQHVVINALEKVKDFDVLSTPVYKQKTPAESFSNGTAKPKANNHSNQASNNAAALNANVSSSAASSNQAVSNGVSAKPNKQQNAQQTNGTNGDHVSKGGNRVSLNNGSASANGTKDSKDSKDSGKSADSKPTSANSQTANKPPKSAPAASSGASSTQPSTNGVASNKDQAKKQPVNATVQDNKKKSTNGVAGKDEDHKEEKKPTTANNKPNGTANANNVKKDLNEPKQSTLTSSKETSSTQPKPASASASKPDPKPAAKSAPKPAASKPPSSATAGKEADKVKEPTKKPLSIDFSNTKKPNSSATKSAPEAKKEPTVESRIITKRDPKPKPAEAVVEPAVEPVIVAACAVVPVSFEQEPVEVVKNEALSTEPSVVTSSSLTSFYCDPAASLVSNEVAASVNYDEIPAASPVNNDEEGEASTATTPVEPADSDEIVTEQIINIELISSNLENSNEIIKENFNGTSESHSNEVKTANAVNYGEWPNLSPVKKDQNGASAGGDYLDENGNNSIDDGNESGQLLNGLAKPAELNFQAGNLIADPADLIVSPNDDMNTESHFDSKKNDIMTRSFIDDGSSGNPFAEKIAPTPNRKQILDDSENDLNKTHELTDEETSLEQINGGHQNGHHANPDQLCEAIESMTIDSKQTKGNGFDDIPSPIAVVASNDPASWNLLELPKPVNPNDLPAAPVISNSTSNTNDKKLTPNGKKMNPVGSSLSPSNAATAITSESNNVVKSASMGKHQANNAAVKPSKPVNPAYVEVSYIPAHGNSYYVDADFFRKVRARHYILSTEEPNEQVLNALIEAKETWEEKSLQVSIIPTYESDVMRRWFEANEENLARLKIEVTPAANFSTVTMDDNPDLSCQVYKLEF